MTYQPGAILHNRYRIVKLLGQGGFGALYRVWDTALGRPCALKENLDAAPEAQRQFLREAKILANLVHPNLPRVTDYFIEGAKQYLVMDYIEGQDLQEMLEDRGAPLPEDKAVFWICQICDALTHLHSQKPPIIHRDIKPANIKITPNGTAVLVDFGIAKVYDPSLKTTQGAQAVTPGYSPYEQYGKGATDARTDIYALGATLYTILTGVEPPESIQRVTRDPLIPARQLNPNLSLRASSALTRALQMDPSQRFQSAADFKAALSPAARQPQAPPLPASTPLSGAPAIAAPQTPGASWAVIALVMGLASFVVILLIALLSGGRSPSAPPGSLPATAEKTPLLTWTVAVTDSPPLEVAASPTATLEPLEYTVQVGDTCSEIAQTFAVSLAEIAAINDLPPDCGVIYAGQKLLIPQSPGITVKTPAAEILATPPTPVAVQVAAEDGMEMVLIPEGEFWMGSPDSDAAAGKEEKPLHAVYLRAYWIDRTEVTNAMYARCVAAGVCRQPEKVQSNVRPSYYDNTAFAAYPVIYVSWGDANDYCRWVNRRLPSEAEWEKAARGTDGRAYPWGEAAPSARLANFNRQVGDASRVGSYPAGSSPFGVLDMAGNVAEWVQDWYGENYYTLSSYTNPPGPAKGEFRVLRGGSWYNLASAMRAAFRLWNYPDLRSDTVGFRCAR